MDGRQVQRTQTFPHCIEPGSEGEGDLGQIMHTCTYFKEIKTANRIGGGGNGGDVGYAGDPILPALRGHPENPYHGPCLDLQTVQEAPDPVHAPLLLADCWLKCPLTTQLDGLAYPTPRCVLCLPVQELLHSHLKPRVLLAALQLLLPGKLIPINTMRSLYIDSKLLWKGLGHASIHKASQ